jgi:hypothetical protein
MYGIYSSIMSLPSFKFTNIGVPTGNERVNSGLSSSSKMEKTGILSSITEKAQDTFKEGLKQMPDISLDADIVGDGDGDGDGNGSVFSFTNIIKLVLIVVIAWFMWSSLSDNSDFHLGMSDFGSKLKTFFQSMEDKGRELVARITNQPVTSSSSAAATAGNDSDSDSDSDSDGGSDGDAHHAPSSSSSSSSFPPPSSSTAPHRPPVPPSMSNSSDKKPGYIHDVEKYTFLDKADRSYTGPSPRADDSTSVTQKHQSGKAGYCYIGEDRGFRSCVQVQAGDKCMSGQVFSRQDICVNPTLRE